FGILAVEVRQQALDIVVGIRPLFLRGQRLHERLQKSFQTRHDTVEHARADLRVVQQFAQPNSKTSFHRQLSFRRFLLLKGAYTTSTYSCSRPRHSRIRNGVIECVEGGNVLRAGFVERPLLNFNSVEEMFVRSLREYYALFELMDIEPPIFALLSLLGVKGYGITTGGFPQRVPRQFDRDDLLLPD